MPATWDDAFVDFTAEARASLPAEFCQRHLGGYVGPNPLTLDEQARVLAAARERSSTEVQITRLYEAYPMLQVRAQEVTIRETRIAELEMQLETMAIALESLTRRCFDRCLFPAEVKAALDVLATIDDQRQRRIPPAESKLNAQGTALRAIPITEGPAPMPYYSVDKAEGKVS